MHKSPGKPRTHFQELASGYSEDLIAEWCAVDYTTACRYKSGERVPSARALKLFLLHRDGRILPAEWQGFSFRGGLLFDPWGKELPHGVLRAYPFLLQLLRDAVRGDADRSRELDRVLCSAWSAPSPAAALSAAEAQPSIPVRYDSPRTVRRRNERLRARANTAARQTSAIAEADSSGPADDGR